MYWQLQLRKTVLCALLSCSTLPALAADNQLSPADQEAGWQLLFDGQSLTGWQNNDDQPLVAGIVQDGSINPHGCGGYLLVHERPLGDFEFQCDVRMSAGECNSGIFFRIGDLKDPIMTGLELQVFSPPGMTKHDFGALYDLVAPSMIATREPGEWNTLHLRCEGPLIAVSVNGQLVAEMNCDEFAQPGKCPDGTDHKFVRAIKDFARSGYVGLQDHGHDVWYKNIKARELK